MPGSLATASRRQASEGGKRRSSGRSAEISSMDLLDARGERGETCADVGGIRGLFGTRVLDEQLVVVDRGAGLPGRLELARQVVVRRGVVRIDLEGAAEA